MTLSKNVYLNGSGNHDDQHLNVPFSLRILESINGRERLKEVL